MTMLPATRRLIVGVVLMVGVTSADTVWGVATSGSRIDPAVRAAAAQDGMVNIVVSVGFRPEGFHLRFLQSIGTLGGSTDSTVIVKRVRPEELDVLARTPWIAHIQLAE